MRQRHLDLTFLGLSLSSSWGNGHATTYRALLRGLAERGHRVLFLERDVPWYSTSRDLPQPDFCDLAFYHDPGDLRARFSDRIATADAVVVGSYVPDGIAVLELVNEIAGGVRAFYDIDTPVTVAALEQERCAYLAARQLADLDLYLSFTGGPLLTYLTDRFGVRCPRPLYCAVDDELYHPQDLPPAWDLGYLGTYAPDRQPALERLLLEPARRLPKCRFVVAGPQYPDSIAWPPNVERIHHLAPAEHVAFYCRQRFTLNITRADMARAGWSPSVRLFEAAACGTPIISDRWEGLDRLLPDGDAIVIADTPDEVVRPLRDLDDARRIRIGRSARKIVLANHTGQARACELEQHLREFMGQVPTQLIRQPSHINGIRR
jgi:spore maturation protein CgeB